MGFKIEKIKFNLLSLEQSLRFDYGFLNYKNNQLEISEFYTFSDLFDFVEKKEIDLSLYSEINYVEIGDISKQGDINPVKLDLDNRDEFLESYYKKIDKGDIIAVKKGDILISSIRPNLKKIALIQEESENYFYTKALIHLRPKINSIIAYYLLRTISFKYINSVSRIGKGYPTLKVEDLKTISFNKKIIDKLVLKLNTNKIDTILEQIRELKNKFELEVKIINEVFAEEFNYDKNLWRKFGKGMTAGTQKSNEKTLSIFAANFSELENSEAIRFSSRFHRPEVKKIQEILNKYNSINVSEVLLEIIKGVQPIYDNNGETKVIKITNMKNSYIDLEENVEFASDNFCSKINENSMVRQGDILVCCTGKVSLGKIDIYENEEKTILSVDSYLMRLKNFNSLYFTYFFRSILGSFQIERDYTGTTNQIHLYDKNIMKFKIININIKEQERIVKKIQSRIQDQQKYTKEIEAKRAEIEKLILDSLTI